MMMDGCGGVFDRGMGMSKLISTDGGRGLSERALSTTDMEG